MKRSILMTLVPLSIVTAAFVAAGGAKANEPFYYRKELVANARANAAKYPWAKAIYEKKVGDARRWAGWTDERVLHYVPDVTPMRPCDCPNCGKYWREYIWNWSADRPDEVVCRFCGKTTSLDLFPENDVFVCADPQGVDQKLPFYRDAKGKRFFIRSLLGHYQFLHATTMAVTLAEAYVQTGEKPFAQKSVRLLRRMGEVYPGYVLKDWENFGQKPWGLAGKISGWHYEDATAVGSLARAYDAVRAGGLVGVDDARVIEDGLFRKCGEMLVAMTPESGVVNDIPHRFAGVASIARVLGDDEMMRWVLNDKNGFMPFVETRWLPDGHWIERAPSYDLMALSNFHLTPWVLTGYRPGLDLRGLPQVKKINAALFGIVWPDGTMPAMSDSHVESRPSPTLAEINYAWYGGRENLAALRRAYDGQLLERGDEFAFWNRNPNIDRELKDLGPATPPALSSLHLPHLGITMLRSPGADPEVIFLDHGEWAGWHSHFDRLGIMLWAFGREMSSDLGYVYAAHPLRAPWTIQTLAHNTVVVDGQSQAKPGKAGVVLVRLDNAVQAVEAEAPAAYPEKTTEYRRTIVQIPAGSGAPLVADIFRVRGGTVHDWSYHVEAGPPALSGVTLGSGESLGAETPYTQLSDIRTGIAEGDWTAVWRWEDGAGLRLWMCGSPGTQVNEVQAPGQRLREEEGKRLPYLIVRRSGGQPLASTFVCVHEPFRGTAGIRSVRLLEADSGRAEWPVALKVETAGKTWWIASKLDEGAWRTAPPAMPRPEAGRLSVRSE
ncbi:MAG: hypothetical protein A2W03_07170 [Candidatus Aminicenantes bacterium RBG_16_63_16]|nr:MAG: hypothetical protein A2W03_07170 [Candidatus Aminicenantes bacterium RBG_16_63_16]